MAEGRGNKLGKTVKTGGTEHGDIINESIRINNSGKTSQSGQVKSIYKAGLKTATADQHTIQSKHLKIKIE